jgi:hypothetical protein
VWVIGGVGLRMIVECDGIVREDLLVRFKIGV